MIQFNVTFTIYLLTVLGVFSKGFAYTQILSKSVRGCMSSHLWILLDSTSGIGEFDTEHVQEIYQMCRRFTMVGVLRRSSAATNTPPPIVALG